MTGLPLFDHALTSGAAELADGCRPSPSAFDPTSGDRAKREGIARAETTNERFVRIMRAEARRIALERGSVHIDDLRRRSLELGIAPLSPGAWGACLGGKGWRRIGYRASAWPSSHSHVSPIWQSERRSTHTSRNYRSGRGEPSMHAHGNTYRLTRC